VRTPVIHWEQRRTLRTPALAGLDGVGPSNRAVCGLAAARATTDKHVNCLPGAGQNGKRAVSYSKSNDLRHISNQSMPVTNYGAFPCSYQLASDWDVAKDRKKCLHEKVD